jgi:hypothetical protein
VPIASLFAAVAVVVAAILQSAARGTPYSPRLTSADRSAGERVSQLARHDVRAAVAWARRNADIASVAVGLDRHTIVLHYRDGRELIVLPSHAVPVRIASTPRLPLSTARDSAATRALVLEPFATQLGFGPTTGDDEANALRAAGFSVDVLRDAQVTVPVMQSIPQYAVTYIETHAGVLPDGDAVVISGETDPGPYAGYYRDHTLAQATVSGDPTKALYNGVTGAFFIQHAAPFAAGSLFYINGCMVLDAPNFWPALQSRGLQALISWNGEAEASTDQTAGPYVLQELSHGLTVDSVVADALQKGVGVSVGASGIAHLGYVGNGQETLANALQGSDPATPTATPSPPATPKPTIKPTPTPRPKKKGACKPGHHRSHGRCVKTIHHKK